MSNTPHPAPMSYKSTVWPWESCWVCPVLTKTLGGDVTHPIGFCPASLQKVCAGLGAPCPQLSTLPCVHRVLVCAEACNDVCVFVSVCTRARRCVGLRVCTRARVYVSVSVCVYVGVQTCVHVWARHAWARVIYIYMTAIRRGNRVSLRSLLI